MHAKRVTHGEEKLLEGGFSVGERGWGKEGERRAASGKSTDCSSPVTGLKAVCRCSIR